MAGSWRRTGAVAAAVAMVAGSFAGLAASQGIGYGVGLPDAVQARLDDADRVLCATTEVCPRRVTLTALGPATEGAVQAYVDGHRYETAPDPVAGREERFPSLLAGILDPVPVVTGLVGQVPVDVPPLPIDPGLLPDPGAPETPVSGLVPTLPAVDPAGELSQAADGAVALLAGSQALLLGALADLLGLLALGDALELVPVLDKDVGGALAPVPVAGDPTDGWSVLPPAADALRVAIVTDARMPDGSRCVNRHAGALALPNLVDVHRGCDGSPTGLAPDLLVEIAPTAVPSGTGATAAGVITLTTLAPSLEARITVDYDVTTVAGAFGAPDAGVRKHVLAGVEPGPGTSLPRVIAVPFTAEWGTTPDAFTVTANPQVQGAPPTLTVTLAARTISGAEGDVAEDTALVATLSPPPSEMHVTYSSAAAASGGRHLAFTWQADVRPRADATILTAGPGGVRAYGIHAGAIPEEVTLDLESGACPACAYGTVEVAYEASHAVEDFRFTHVAAGPGALAEHLDLTASRVPLSLAFTLNPEARTESLTVPEPIPDVSIDYRVDTPGLPADALRRFHVAATGVPSHTAEWSFDADDHRVAFDALGQEVERAEVAATSAPTFAIPAGLHAALDLGAAGTFAATARVEGVSFAEARLGPSGFGIRVRSLHERDAPFLGRFASGVTGEHATVTLTNLPTDVSASASGHALRFNASQPIRALGATGLLDGYEYRALVGGVPAVPVRIAVGDGRVIVSNDVPGEAPAPAGLGATVGSVFLDVWNPSGLIEGSRFRHARAWAMSVPAAFTAAYDAAARRFEFATGDPASLTIGVAEVTIATERAPADAAAFLAGPGDRLMLAVSPAREVVAARLTGVAVAEGAWPGDGLPAFTLKAAGGEAFLARADAWTAAGGHDWTELALSRLPANVAITTEDTAAANGGSADRQATVWTSATVARLALSGRVGTLAYALDVVGLPALRLEVGWKDDFASAYLNRTGATFLPDGTPQTLPVETTSASAVIGSVAARARDDAGLAGTRFREARVVAAGVPASFDVAVDAGAFRAHAFTRGRDVADVDVRVTTHPGRWYRTEADAAVLDPRAGAYYAREGAFEAFRARVPNLREVEVAYAADDRFSLLVRSGVTGGFLARHHATTGDEDVRGFANATLTSLPERLRLAGAFDADGRLETLEFDASGRVDAAALDVHVPGAADLRAAALLRGIHAVHGRLDLATGTGVALARVAGEDDVLVDALTVRVRSPLGLFEIAEAPMVDVVIDAAAVPPLEVEWDDAADAGEVVASRGAIGRVLFAAASAEGRAVKKAGDGVTFVDAPWGGLARLVSFTALLAGVERITFRAPTADAPFNVTLDLDEPSRAPFTANYTVASEGGRDHLEVRFSALPAYVAVEGDLAGSVGAHLGGDVELVTVAARLPARDLRAVAILERARAAHWTIALAEHAFTVRPSEGALVADRLQFGAESASGELPGDARRVVVDLAQPTGFEAAWWQNATGPEYQLVADGGIARADLSVMWTEGPCVVAVPPERTENVALYLDGTLTCRTPAGVSTVEARGLGARVHALERFRMRHSEGLSLSQAGHRDLVLNASIRLDESLGAPRDFSAWLRSEDVEIRAFATNAAARMSVDTNLLDEYRYASSAAGADVWVSGMVAEDSIEAYEAGGHRLDDLLALFQLELFDSPASARVAFSGDPVEARAEVELSESAGLVRVSAWDRDADNALGITSLLVEIADVPPAADVEWRFGHDDVRVTLDMAETTRRNPGPFVQFLMSQDDRAPRHDASSWIDLRLADNDPFGTLPLAAAGVIADAFRHAEFSYAKRDAATGGGGNANAAAAPPAPAVPVPDAGAAAVAAVASGPIAAGAAPTLGAVRALADAAVAALPAGRAASSVVPTSENLVAVLSRVPEEVTLAIAHNATVGAGVSVSSNQGAWAGPWEALVVDYSASQPIGEAFVWIPDRDAFGMLRNLYVEAADVPERVYIEVPEDDARPGPMGAEWYVAALTSSDADATVSWPVTYDRVVNPALSGPLPATPIRLRAFGMSFAGIGGFDGGVVATQLVVHVSTDPHYPFLYVDTGGRMLELEGATPAFVVVLPGLRGAFTFGLGVGLNVEDLYVALPLEVRGTLHRICLVLTFRVRLFDLFGVPLVVDHPLTLSRGVCA